MKSSNIKKYIPWILLAVLTIALMIFFKYSDKGYVALQSTGKDLLAEYTRGLFPVFSKSSLTDEDIFNFALYNSLPLDKENNKVLQLESDSYGNDNYKIESVKGDFKSENYTNFKKQFELDETEEKKIDSILNSYKDDLYASVLINEEGDVAFDPNLSNLHKSLGADIYNFSFDRINIPNYANVTQPKKDTYKSVSSFESVSDSQPRKYIIMTPDTVFGSDIVFDSKELFTAAEEFINQDKTIEGKSGKLIPRVFPEKAFISPLSPEEYHYTIDSNFWELTIPTSLNLSQDLLVYDSLKIELDMLAEELNKIKLGFSSSLNGLNFKYKGPLDKDNDVEIDLDFGNLGAVITESINAAMQATSTDWEAFGMKMDSLSKNIYTESGDSLSIIKLKQISEELKKAKRESRKKNRNN
ncbi:MAG: hypothetical protein JW995_06850 [Melioribacteraceae bacterium]|nr:hypothetical protein [Melioribacteraceae bacterium]